MYTKAGFKKRHTSRARAIRLLCPEIPADAPHILMIDNMIKAKIFSGMTTAMRWAVWLIFEDEDIRRKAARA